MASSPEKSVLYTQATECGWEESQRKPKVPGLSSQENSGCTICRNRDGGSGDWGEGDELRLVVKEFGELGK